MIFSVLVLFSFFLGNLILYLFFAVGFEFPEAYRMIFYHSHFRLFSSFLKLESSLGVYA